MRTFIISLVLALLAVTPAVPAAQDAKIVYIGEVSQDALRKLKRYKPLTAYLDARLGSKGYKFKTMMPKDLTQAADFLQTGRLDIFIDSVAPMYYTSGVLEARARAAGKPEVGMTIGCRRWKKGVREYTSVILTRKKDGVAKLAELKGKIMGFEDPWSTSGYFLPRAALQEAGLVLHRIEKAGEPAQADKVSYAFFEGSEKAVSFLMAGKADAVGVEQGAYDVLTESERAEVQLIYRSPAVPRHLVGYRPGLDPALVDAVNDALVAANGTEEGKAFLLEFEETTRFEAFEGGDEPKLRAFATDFLKRANLLRDR